MRRWKWGDQWEAAWGSRGAMALQARGLGGWWGWVQGVKFLGCCGEAGTVGEEFQQWLSDFWQEQLGGWRRRLFKWLGHQGSRIGKGRPGDPFLTGSLRC